MSTEFMDEEDPEILGEVAAATAVELPPPKKSRKYKLTNSDPLVKACKKGDVKAIQNIFNNFDPDYDLIEYLNAPDQAGSHSIFHTVWPGHSAALELLLKTRADPNIQNQRENTALHLACERLHTKIIYLLIRFGADATLLNAKKLLCWQTCATEQEQQAMKQYVERCVLARRNGFSHNDAILETEDPNAITPAKRIFYVKQALESHKVTKQAFKELASPSATPLLASGLVAFPKIDLAAGIRLNSGSIMASLNSKTEVQGPKIRKRTKKIEDGAVTSTSPFERHRAKASDLASAARETVVDLVRRAPPDATAAAILRAREAKQQAKELQKQQSCTLDSLFYGQRRQNQLDTTPIFLNSGSVNVSDLIRASVQREENRINPRFNDLVNERPEDTEFTSWDTKPLDSIADGFSQRKRTESDSPASVNSLTDAVDFTDPKRFMGLVQALARQSHVKPENIYAPPALPAQYQRRELNVRAALARILTSQNNDHERGVIRTSSERALPTKLIEQVVRVRPNSSQESHTMHQGFSEDEPLLGDSLKLFQSMTVGKKLALVTDALEVANRKPGTRPSQQEAVVRRQTSDLKQSESNEGGAEILDHVVSDLVTSPASRAMLSTRRPVKEAGLADIGDSSFRRSPQKLVTGLHSSRGTPSNVSARENSIREARNLIQQISVDQRAKIIQAAELAATPALKATLLRELAFNISNDEANLHSHGQYQQQVSTATASFGLDASSQPRTLKTLKDQRPSFTQAGIDPSMYPVLGSRGEANSFDREFLKAGASITSVSNAETVATLDAMSFALAAPRIPLEKRVEPVSVEQTLEDFDIMPDRIQNDSSNSKKIVLPLYHSLDTMMKMKINDLQAGKKIREQRMATNRSKRESSGFEKNSQKSNTLNVLSTDSYKNEDEDQSGIERRKFKFQYDKYVEAAAMGRRMFDLPVNPEASLSRARWLIKTTESAKAAEATRTAQRAFEDRKRRLYGKTVVHKPENGNQEQRPSVMGLLLDENSIDETSSIVRPSSTTGISGKAMKPIPSETIKRNKTERMEKRIQVETPVNMLTKTLTTKAPPPPYEIAVTMQRQRAERLASRRKHSLNDNEYNDEKEHIDSELKGLVQRFDEIMTQNSQDILNLAHPQANNDEHVAIDQLRPEISDAIVLTGEESKATQQSVSFRSLRRSLDSTHMMLVATGLTRGEPVQHWWPKLRDSFQQDRKQLMSIKSKLGDSEVEPTDDKYPLVPEQRYEQEKHAWLREWRDQLESQNIQLPPDIQSYFEVALAASPSPAEKATFTKQTALSKPKFERLNDKAEELQLGSESISQLGNAVFDDRPPIMEIEDDSSFEKPSYMKAEWPSLNSKLAQGPSDVRGGEKSRQASAALKIHEYEKARWRAERDQANKLSNALHRRDALLTIRGGTHLQSEKADDAFMRRAVTMLSFRK